MSSDALHMVRVQLTARDLYGAASHARHANADLGYAVHWALVSAFGDAAPSPFVLRRETGRNIEVLGYARHDATELRRAAHGGELGRAARAIVLASLGSKVMPTRWRVGSRLGFELRACPVVRMSSSGVHHRRGAEVDAFLAACRRSPDAAVDRGAVYRAWLCRQFEGPGAEGDRTCWQGGVRVLDVTMRRFRRARLFRREQGGERPGRRLERPDATLSGTLEVTDAGRFSRLMARGIGRHRAFGFGMLLLRRETTC